ncbi:probable fucosyltransferase 8 isoform X2 [Zea mays]|uniref:Fucosyltransferase n=1 Tax=Zea mays TaxID=4577 RepID=A0A804Q4C3_MAIZE|nr:probable fucosyltransferase 8 isoform X2 [Zea mays]|eukprot:XP_008651984.1 probable fucosyltransferase 8 isoform X2 [Zea mays]
MAVMSGAADSMLPKLVDDPEAVALAVEPWAQPGRKNKKTCRRALLVGSLMTLLLLACFVLGRESASSAAWLQIDLLAKLTAMNNGTAGLTTTTHAPHGRDELLGGLLPAGMNRRTCRSRYESWRYYKYFPYAASPHLQDKLRAYEARHRRCAPGTPLYAKSVEQLRSGRSADGMECTYVVWLPFDGLGNRMLSMVSGFLYALLTDRVFLAALPADSADLFCEPFPDTTWRLPLEDFPVADLLPRGQSIERSYTSLLDAKEVGPDANATAGVPPYVYVSLGWQLKDPLFFCGEHQLVLGKVNWLLLYSDLYFSPSLYAVAEFQDELRRLFPAKESVGHLLSRYLFHPTNPVWSLTTRYYRSYLATAKRRIGVQVRMFSYGSISADDMYSQILACSQQEHILPETEDGDEDEVVAATRNGDNADGSNSTAILVASLYADYYERLRSRYYDHGAKGGERVAVFQPSHEERQATDNMAHNQRALAEIYLLSFSEELLTSGRSTFGYVSSNLAGVRPTIMLTAYDHKIPEPPCRRAVSMEPCNLTPPLGVECRGKPVDKEDLARHLRVCEDSKDSVKLFD